MAKRKRARAEERLQHIKAALQSVSYIASSEEELAVAICQTLTDRGVAFESEFDLGAHGRIDVMCDSVGIEIKHRYATASVLRQLDRYSQSTQIEALMLATTSRRLAAEAPSTLRGKPVIAVLLEGSL